MSSIARTYYIYTLSHPAGSAFYVGQSTNPQNRYYGHLSAAKRGVASLVYDTLREMSSKPILTIVDEITTCHDALVLKLEACWRWVLINQGIHIHNTKQHGHISLHDKAIEYTAVIKRYASVSEERLQELYEMEIREAFLV